MKHLPIILTILLLAACQPQPVVNRVQPQYLQYQEMDKEAEWDAAQERAKQLEADSAAARQARFQDLAKAIKEMK